jgi:hypothetical protein
LFNGTSEQLEAIKAKYHSALNNYALLNPTFRLFERVFYSHEVAFADTIGPSPNSALNLVVFNPYGTGIDSLLDCRPLTEFNVLPKTLYQYVSGDPDGNN